VSDITPDDPATVCTSGSHARVALHAGGSDSRGGGGVTTWQIRVGAHGVALVRAESAAVAIAIFRATEQKALRDNMRAGYREYPLSRDVHAVPTQ
jgi:hypothetical protein